MVDMDWLYDFVKAKNGHVHFVGVCGVGMAGLAFHLRKRGFCVTGCDNSCNNLSQWLEDNGVSVACSHDPAHLLGVDLVVRTSAVCQTHPEISAAKASGIPVFQRGLVLSALLQDNISVLVSGTHGKTTSASMIVQALRGCGLSPSFCIGGDTPILGGVAGIGTSSIMVVEADESDGTLAYYEPDIAIVTNIEFEHAEQFENIDQLKNCFSSMVRNVKRRLIFCKDSSDASHICQSSDKAYSYGFLPDADLHAWRVEERGFTVRFHISLQGNELGEVMLPVPGLHNIHNALAACAVALELNAKFSNIRKALMSFEPVRRRFERVIETDDLVMISDYAHHPSEVSALVRSAFRIKRSRWIAVFQPHRFTRTRALGKDFPSAFNGLDELIIAPVYPASEEMLPEGTSWDLYALFRKIEKINVICAFSLNKIWSYLKVTLQKGDGLLIIGAGDVEKIAELAKAESKSGKLNKFNSVAQWKQELTRLALDSTKIHVHAPLADKTSLHVGGCADILLDVGSEQDIVRILKWGIAHKKPVIVLGAGSNVLVSDLGVRGIVMRLTGPIFKDIRQENKKRIVVGAGIGLNELACWLAEHGKSGLEFLRGIPGTIGGALIMNAGAWGKAIGDCVFQVRVINTADGSVQIIKKGALQFAYRECKSLCNSIILNVTLEVECDAPVRIRERMHAVVERRAWMKGLHSAGSVFKNPEGHFSGRLIEQAGLKGAQVGRARVSEKHANMIVTEPGANASDVAALIEIIQNKVKERFDVELKKEIICLE